MLGLVTRDTSVANDRRLCAVFGTRRSRACRGTGVDGTLAMLVTCFGAMRGAETSPASSRGGVEKTRGNATWSRCRIT